MHRARAGARMGTTLQPGSLCHSAWRSPGLVSLSLQGVKGLLALRSSQKGACPSPLFCVLQLCPCF